jgi:hypothetical protein
MAIATGTAIAIAAASSAGASAYAAHKQGKAAKEASQQQVAAAQQAMAAQAPLYQQALQIAQQQAQQGRADLMPYAQQGGQGLTALTAFLGLPSSGGGMPPPQNPAAVADVQQLWRGMQTAPPQAPDTRAGAGGPPGTPTGGIAVPRGSGLATPTVMLRAPTGQMQAVPADHVDFYLARGAQRV